MQIMRMKCPACGSDLQVEDGLETFFCQYCGQRIILSGQSEHLVKAKVDMEKMKHEERMYQLKTDNENKKRKENDNFMKYYLLFTLLFIIICGIAALVAKIAGWI